jgi:hypothetical protein
MGIVQDFLANGGQIFRIVEDERTITVAYKYSSAPTDEGIRPYVVYGSSIHRKTAPCDNFVRRPHNETAVTRCMNKPVVIPHVFEDQYEMWAGIRLAMYRYGCSEKRDFEATDPEHIARQQCS